VAGTLEHFELEEYIKIEGFELLRLLLQDHFDLRASREERIDEVLDAAGRHHGAVEANHERPLTTIVGTAGSVVSPTAAGVRPTCTLPTRC